MHNVKDFYDIESNFLFIHPNRIVDIVPAIVQQKMYPLTANPLFSAEIVFKIIVTLGAPQHSATKYSSAREIIDIQKLLLIRVHPIIVGIPNMPENMHT